MQDCLCTAVQTTWAMERLPIPEQTNLGKVLFYPWWDETGCCVKLKRPSDEITNVEGQLNMNGCVALTCWQKDTTWFDLRKFGISGTTANHFARNDLDARKLLVQHAATLEPPEAMTLDQAAEILCKSWFFPRGTQTADMKSGSLNERNVFEAIAKQPWCKCLCEVGLLQRIDFRGAIVSPDGVGRFVMPEGEDGEEDEVIAACEIKTRSDEVKLSKLWGLQREKGTDYIKCNVGDNTWWEVVPPENRAQVVHQAMVTGLDHVLFVSASKGGIILSCLVHVTRKQRNTFKEALAKFKPLLDWFHDSIDCSGNPPTPHEAFNQKNRYLCATHVRMSRAFHKLIRERKGPLPPVRLVKSPQQLAYNKLKGGIDASTANEKSLHARAKHGIKDDVEHRLPKRAIDHAVANSHKASHCLHFANDDSWKTVNQFRNKVKKCKFSLNQFAMKLSMDLASESIHLQHKQHISSPACRRSPHLLTKRASLAAEEPDNDDDEAAAQMGKLTAHQQKEVVEEAQRLKRKRKRVVELFNAGNGRKLRLNGRHLKIGNWSKKNPTQTVPLTCVLCGKGAHFHCSVCGVTLHKEAAYEHPQTTSCWDVWHTNKTNLVSKFSEPKPKMKKKQKTASETDQSAEEHNDQLEAQKQPSSSRKQTSTRKAPLQPAIATSPVTRRLTRSSSKKHQCN
jgi:hypothetical protein